MAAAASASIFLDTSESSGALFVGKGYAFRSFPRKRESGAGC